MASTIILSDNGASSGSAGLKTTGGNDGVLLLQTTTSGGTPTTAISISNTQVVTYTNQPTYTGGTANGVLYLNGSKAVTSGTALVFDGSNLGVGVTPSAWGGTSKVLQLPAGSLESRGSTITTAQNAYFNGTNWIYSSTAAASLLAQTGGAHYFYNAASGTAGNAITFTQAMTLDASGNLGIGSTAPTALFTLVAANNYPFIHWNNASNTNVAYAGWHGGGGGADDFRIGTASTKPITFFTNGSERGRFNAGAPILCLAGGNASATGTGIAFPASQNSSSDANTLDDYEEGFWTPVFYGTGAAGTFSPSSSNGGRYVKVGMQVTCWANVNGSLSGASGDMNVSGLPFTNAGNGGTAHNAVYSTGAIQYWAGISVSPMGPLILPGTTNLYFHTYTGASAGASGAQPAVVNGVNMNCHFFVTYFTVA